MWCIIAKPLPTRTSLFRGLTRSPQRKPGVSPEPRSFLNSLFRIANDIDRLIYAPEFPLRLALGKDELGDHTNSDGLSLRWND